MIAAPKKFDLALNDAERIVRGLQLLECECELVTDLEDAFLGWVDPFELINMDQETTAFLVLKFSDRSDLMAAIITALLEEDGYGLTNPENI